MRVAIVGAGSVGRAITLELLRNAHDVTLLDSDPDAIRVSQIPDADWALCDACSPKALEDAGLRDCDALVAATGDDKTNLVVSLVAKNEFAVPKVVARVNDPTNEWLFTSDWGVDIPTSTPQVMAALVEEAVTSGDAVRLFSFNTSDIGVYTLVVPADSPLIGVPLTEYEWPKGVTIETVVRDATPLPTRTLHSLEAGDDLVVVAGLDHQSQVEELEAIVQGFPSGEAREATPK